jgi:hypothetical protein
MKRFQLGQKIKVKKILVLDDRTGTVVRLRHSDNGAWIKIDGEHSDRIDWPFPADDVHGRANHVCLYPEDCELLKEQA